MAGAGLELGGHRFAIASWVAIVPDGILLLATPTHHPKRGWDGQLLASLSNPHREGCSAMWGKGLLVYLPTGRR